MRSIWAGAVLALALVACKEETAGPSGEVESITVSPPTPTLLVGASQRFTATARNSRGGSVACDLAWQSSDPARLIVDEDGDAIAVSAGAVEVRARCDGVTGAATVTVTNPVPAVSAISPATIGAGSAAFTLTVTGTGFNAASRIRWNGTVRPTALVSATTLTTSVTTADIANEGAVAITVFNSGPGGGSSGELSLMVTAPGPTITTLLPATATEGAAALQLTVQGSRFTNGAVVHWNGAPRTTTYVSATELRAAITAADLELASDAAVTVVNPAPTPGTSVASTFAIGTTVKVAMGYEHACAIKATGAAYCWGSGFYGQLGNGASGNWNVRSTVPTPVQGGHAFREISSGIVSSCGITRAGKLYCWGFGQTGQLGNGSLTNSAIPVAVMSALTFRQVSIGGGHACAVTVSGQGYCWGSNQHGELGTGSVSSGPMAQPVAVSGSNTFKQLAAGVSHTCGLTTTGAALCWGNGQTGELGDGTNNSRLVPAPVSGGLTFTSLSAGLLWAGITHQTCGVTTNGSLYCWGTPPSEFVDDADDRAYEWFEDQWSPRLLPGGQYTTVAASATHGCALLASGTARCWGYNSNGQLGNGTANSSMMPVNVTGGVTFKSISVGQLASCGVSTSSEVYCWGSHGDGLLADGVLGWQATPMAVSGGRTYTAIATARSRTCAVDVSKAVYCWGTTSPFPGSMRDDRTTPTLLPGGHQWSAITGGNETFCGLALDGTAYCWGSDNYEARGDGFSPALPWAPTPRAVASAQKFTSIGLSDDVDGACATSQAGGFYCWGNEHLETTRPVPTIVPGGGTYASASALGGHECALKADGSAFCWGLNSAGQLGDGSTTKRNAPVAVSGGLHFAQLTGASNHTCGIALSGEGYCWGVNERLGDGSSGTGSQTTPKRIPGPQLWRSIDAAYFLTCATTTTNVAYCWSPNELITRYGILGAGTNLSAALTPREVSGPPLAMVSAGFTHACGLTPAGAAWCWGQAQSGALGNGTRGYRPSPAAIVW